MSRWKKWRSHTPQRVEARASLLTRIVQKRTYDEVAGETSDEHIGAAAKRAKTSKTLARVDRASCLLVVSEAAVTRAVERDAPDAEVADLEFAASAVGASAWPSNSRAAVDAESYVAKAKRGETKRRGRAADRVAYIEATNDEPLPKLHPSKGATKGEMRAKSRDWSAAYRARGYRGVRDCDDAEHTLQVQNATKAAAKRWRRGQARKIKAGLKPKSLCHPNFAGGLPRAAEDVDLPKLQGHGSCFYAKRPSDIRDHVRIQVNVKKKDCKGAFSKVRINLKNDVAGSPDHGKHWWNSVEAATAAFNAYFGL